MTFVLPVVIAVSVSALRKSDPIRHGLGRHIRFCEAR